MQQVKNKIFNLLKWSEKYTKTDMIYLGKGGFWLGFSHGMQMLFGIVMLIAFANFIPKEVYGTYQFILSAVGIISMFTLTGMGTAILQATSQGSESAFHYGSKVKLKWSIGITITAGILAIYYYLNDNTTLATAFIIAGAFQPLISSFDLYSSFLTGKQLFKEKSILEILQRTLPFVAILPTILLTNNILIIILIYFVSNAVSLFLIYIFIIHKHPAPPTQDKSLSNYSKHLSVMTAFSNVANHLDKILIWYFLGAVPVAIYALAQSPIGHMKSIFKLIHLLTFPKLAKKSLPELKTILPDKIRRYFLITALAVGIYIILAPYIFSVLFPVYIESVIYSQILALSILAVPRSLIGQVLIAYKMKKEQYVLNISTPVVRIILLLSLLPFYGIWGAIIAILVTEIYATILQWLLFYKKIR